MKKKIIFIFLCISLNSYGKQISYSIPFELSDNRILISGKLDHVKCKFLYDTGAGSSNVEESFLKKFKIDKNKLDLSLNGGFKIRNHSLKSQDIKKYDINAKHSAVIGLDFFSGYHIEIDYPHRKINLYQTNDVAFDDLSVIELHRHTTNLYLYKFFYIETKLKINDIIVEGEFLIDTGSSRTITLLNYDDKYKKLNDEIRNKGKYVEIKMDDAHFNGLGKFIMTKNSEFFFGNKMYKKLTVDVSDVKLKDFKENNFVGIIGGGFLKQFKLHHSLDGNNLAIIPSEQNDSIRNNLFTDGFKFKKENNKVVVNGICSSPNFESPIELGDEILEVDGKSVKKIDLKKLRSRKKEAGNGFIYKIKRDDFTFYHKTKVFDVFQLL